MLTTTQPESSVSLRVGPGRLLLARVPRVPLRVLLGALFDEAVIEPASLPLDLLLSASDPTSPILDGTCAA